MILQEAERLIFADLSDRVVEEKYSREEAEQAGTENYNHCKNTANHNANHNHTVIATTVARLFASLDQLLYESPDRRKITRIDHKQRRRIDEKKRAQGMRIG